MRFLYLLSILACAALLACGQEQAPTASGPAAKASKIATDEESSETTLTPEQARAELTRREIPYEGWAFLLYAQMGMLDVVELFVQAGMPLTTKNPDDDFTALHQAATYGRLEVVTYLVGQGAAVDAEGKHGETPFIWAAWNGHLEVVKYLREQGASLLSSTPVGAAHRLAKDVGHTAVVTYIEGQAKAELTKREIPFTADFFVHLVERGDVEAVKLFVQAGMSVDKKHRDATVLMKAAERGSLEIVKYLVENGADVNAAAYGRTALYDAAWQSLEIVKYLIAQGASVTDGHNPLVSAAYRGHLETVKYLVGQGASVTATAGAGQTPLYGAAADTSSGHLETVKYLIAQGADVNAKESSGWTPLIVAGRHGSLEIVKYLVDNGAVVTAMANNGYTVLHTAMYDDHGEVLEKAKYLVGQGADVTATDDDGTTPLELAAGFGHLETVKYLESVGG